MTRQGKGPGRVTPSATELVESGVVTPREIPSFRQRKPVVFWVVVLAVLAMVLSTVAIPIAILLS